MGFNLNRRFKPCVITDVPVYTEKRLSETVSDGQSLVSVVDCDLSHDTYPPYDAFPLEAQLASGVPLQAVNSAVIVDNSPTSVASRVDKILSDSHSEPSNIDNSNKD